MGIKTYIGNFMNFRGSGVFSNKLKVVVLLIPALMLLASALDGAYAAHTATVTISPDIANCDELGNTFTVNVENDGSSSDDIFEVRIYDDSYPETYGIVEFYCGPAPYGWQLYNHAIKGSPDYYGYCEYKTQQFGSYVIEPGENLDFTFDAVIEQEECYSEFLISTLDNVLPTGQHQYHTPQVLIDCADPLLYKYLDGPWYGDCPYDDYIDHGDCWVQDFGTLIVPQVYDHPEDDECNLGLEYCTYRIWLDGSLIGETTFDPEDPEYYIGWDFVFEEDTVHILEIVCEDMAGNVLAHNETFLVDSQYPITWKEFGEPYKLYPGEYLDADWYHDCYQYWQQWCKMETENQWDAVMCFEEALYFECGGHYPQWITSDTPVYLEAEDFPDAPCAVGVEETYWRNMIVPDWFCYEDCVPIDYYCTYCDWAEEHGGAPIWCSEPYWFSVCYGDFGVRNTPWEIYEGEPFYKGEESCHLIEYYSIDYLGNEEPIEWQCVFVDNTPPLSVKEHGTPIVYDEGFDWVTQETTITLDCDDSREGEADHPVYQETLCYKVSFDLDPDGYITDEYCDEFGGDYDEETGYCCVYVGDDIEETVYTFHFMEDSFHDLEYYCVDHLGNDERGWNLMYPPDHPITDDGAWIQWYKVDTIPPTIYKGMIGEDHLAKVGTCPPTSPEDECYVRDDGQNGVYIEAIDGGEICAVDDLYCYYELWWDVPEDVMVLCEEWDDGWCLVQSGEFSDDAEVIFYEDSTHELYVFCNDSLGNWVDDVETFLVDSLPPETTKYYGWPYKVEPTCFDNWDFYCDEIDVAFDTYEDCMYYYTHTYCTWWITSDSEVTLESWDAKVGVDEIYWRNLYFPGNDEICYKYEYPDGLCDGGCLTAGVGLEIMPMTTCHPMYYGEFVDGYNFSDWKTPLAEAPWNVYDGAFKKSPESCHVIEYYAIDELGNEEPLHWQCVFVDNTGPEPVKEVGDPSIFVGEGGDCIYTNVTIEKLDVMFLFDLTGSMSDDLYEVQSNANSIMNDISALADDAAFGVGSFMDYDGMFSYCDYSNSYGSSSCGDYPWNLDQDITTDTSAVETAINSLYTTCGDDGPESYARALYESQFAGWREGAKRVIVIFEDNVPHDCNLGDYGCYSSTTGVDPGRDATAGTSDDLAWADVVADLVGEEISVIVLEADFGECDGVWQYLADETEGIYSQVGDGDIAEEIVALVSEVIIGDCDGFDWWVTTDTPIRISCDDSWDGDAPHPVDQSTMCYKVSFDLDPDGYITDEYCEGDMIDDWCCEYVGEEGYFEFYFEEDSLHDLEFFCMDHLENEGPIDLEYFKVDTTPPTTTKEFHGPFHIAPHPECLSMCEEVCEGDPVCIDDCVEDECTWIEYIDTESWITLDSEDGGEICAVGVDKIWYMNEVYSEGEGTAGCWLPEMYCNPEYYGMIGNLPYDQQKWDGCIDLKQEMCAESWEDWEYESWYECVEEKVHEWCEVDEGWHLYDGDIYKDEESCHVLYYFAVDHLGNIEDLQMNCFFVDKKPPVINKWYGKPYYENDAEWISVETPIYVEVWDDEPHPSGVAEVEYRVTLVNDSYCWDREACVLDAEGSGDWEIGSTYFEFNIDTESCHLIEIWAEDNVGKESLHKQCVFVDDTGPEPIKEVGELKYEWDGTDAVFYDIVDFCATPGNCWKVTMTTPITMECVDPEPHPVDHETLCFKVEFDADDATERYCDWYGGGYNVTGDGYCCMEGNIIEEFYFLEECEHNLDFYCVDILDNVGEHHDEKFKVEGTLFEIPLYKKWNLISVPFVLLDDNPEVVFKDLEGIDRVTTYDGETGEWYVWSAGDGPDSLTSIEPGWGYWVLEMLDEEWLTIGGSLFSPSKLPPSRPLVAGWNLIGYYGTSWTIYDESDLNFMCGDAMVMPDRYIYGDKVYCSLNSLVDTHMGYPTWSSLWSYLNCGGHESYWVGLNTCADPDSPLQMALSRMYAGRGYWVELDEADTYAPATTCIWNDDFECRWTGGGIIP